MRLGTLGLLGKNEWRGAAVSRAVSSPHAGTQQFFIFLEKKSLLSEQEWNKD